ncbi:uncharacterized protein LOC114294713 isoform X1 [Camellia sinensis]|uniref:uncharacterized protein LOC114294713 isoform X1 n=1 Tax=Camellia sinensis TaxID=4442 RepID=UPI001035CA1C|nr:uncharacterized protein LOC114294713 isoform X1 [Camellia sinensis]
MGTRPFPYMLGFSFSQFHGFSFSFSLSLSFSHSSEGNDLHRFSKDNDLAPAISVGVSTVVLRRELLLHRVVASQSCWHSFAISETCRRDLRINQQKIRYSGPKECQFSSQRKVDSPLPITFLIRGIASLLKLKSFLTVKDTLEGTCIVLKHLDLIIYV